MNKHAAIVAAIVIAAVVATTAWLLFGGTGTPAGAIPDRTAAPGEGGGTAAHPVPAADRAEGASGAATAAPAAAARKLPPPPASGESTIVGRVVEAGTRAPIAKAALVLRHPQGAFGVPAESRSDGGFTLDRVPGVLGARVFVSATGYGPRVLRDVNVPPHDRVDLGVIELERGTPLRGVVVTGLGAPISEAHVDLLEARPQGTGVPEDIVQTFRDLRRDDESLDSVATDATGAFAFQAASPGSYVLAARKPGWQMRFSRPVVVAEGAAPPSVVITLGEARPFRGIVKDESGSPIAGASVGALEIFPEEHAFVPKSQKTTTGADGRFSYSSMGTGMIAVIVEARGHAGATRANLAAGKEVEIVLKKASRIEGRVYDRSTSKGLAGAVVVAFRFDETMAVEETRTGSDGSYAFEQAPSGNDIRLFAKLEGYSMPRLAEGGAHPNPLEAMGEVDAAPGGTLHHDIALVAGGSVSGRVVDEETGNGISGAKVTARVTGGLNFLGVFDPLTTLSGTDGAFVFPSVGAGRLALMARAPGYLDAQEARTGLPPPLVPDPDTAEAQTQDPASGQVEVPPGGTVAGRILRLRQGVELDVAVTDPDGAGMAGATVSWVARDDHGLFASERPSRTVICDATGKVRLRGLPRGPEIVVAARHPDFPAGGQITVDTTTPPGRPVTVVLVRSASLSGIVLDPDGKPGAERWIEYRARDNLVGRAFGEDVWTGRAVITDSAGKFLMDNLPPGPGTFKLSFRPAFADHGVEPVEYDLCLDPSDEQVTLTAGKREQVTLHLMRTLAITGTALDAAGKPVGGVMVSASLPQNEAESAGVTWTAEDGTYNLNGLPPGEYAVRAERHPTEPDAPPERLTRTVPAGSTRVDFRFSK